MKTKFTSLLLRALLLIMFALPLKAVNAEVCADWPFMLNCPPNVTISCTDNIYNLSQYGNATYTTYHGTFSAGHPVVQYYLNNCNTGYITRTWMVEYNWVWYNCTQTIYVSSGGYYSGGLNIQWPEDYAVSGCNPNVQPSALPAPHNFPTWTSGPCSMVGRSYSDMVFYINSSCRKVRRTWKVMDWCTYNSSHPGSGGLWTYVQEIKIMDAFEPVLECAKEILADSYNCKNAYVNVPPLSVGQSNCGGTFEIINNSPFSDSKGADISGTYPIGTTKVAYTVKYGCGLIKHCYVNVIVKNAAKPTPYCLGHIITTLMPVDTDLDGLADDGMVEIWAKDLDKGSKANCGFSPLRFSFTTDPTVMNRTFTCEDVGKNHVYIYVTDSRGGQSSCLVTVEIQNNANIPDCRPTPPAPDPDEDDDDVDPSDPDTEYLTGTITDAWGNTLQDAHITMEYAEAELSITTRYDTIQTMQIDSFRNLSGYWVYRYSIEKQVVAIHDTLEHFMHLDAISDSAGIFRFDSLPFMNKMVLLYADYSDNLHKQYINGKDVEALTKHLLGELSFDHPYQYLAADINEDGEVNIEDMTILLQYVTGQIAVLPGDNSWYIFDSGQIFDQPADILIQELNRIIRFDSLAGQDKKPGFIAVRKGDLVQNITESGLTENAVAKTVQRTSLPDAESGFAIYPNPFNQTLHLSILSESEGHAILQLYDVSGKQIWNENNVLMKGINEWSFSPTDGYSGVLYYRLILHDKTHSGKLIKL